MKSVLCYLMILLSNPSCKTRKSQAETKQDVIVRAAMSPVASCYTNPSDFKPTKVFVEKNGKYEFTEEYLDNYLQSNVMFPQILSTIIHYSTQFILNDPEFNWDIDLANSIVFKDSDLDKIAKIVGKAHKSYGIPHSSPRAVFSPSKEISDERLRQLLITSVSSSLLFMTTTFVTFPPLKSSEIKDWVHKPENKERFCSVLNVYNEVRNAYQLESARDLNERWKKEIALPQNQSSTAENRRMVQSKYVGPLKLILQNAVKAKNLNADLITGI